jgi:hypothetical protein
MAEIAKVKIIEFGVEREVELAHKEHSELMKVLEDMGITLKTTDAPQGSVNVRHCDEEVVISYGPRSPDTQSPEKEKRSR